jgi:HEAT repeat protein
MFRIGSGRAQKIRTFSGDCELDAGGMPVYWWSEVDPQQSLTLLATQVKQSRSTKRAERAIQAIAFHAHVGADRLLESFATDTADDVAEKTIFWMGAVRGASGLESLKRLTELLDDTNLREQIAFALYLSKAPGAPSELIKMARQDKDREARGQALFWLSQKAGWQAARVIKSAVENDPELDIRKKAVFALSQLPPDEGIPLLIDVAKAHRHPKVRKQAMFWLGQSGDPRALELFEEILLKK